MARTMRFVTTARNEKKAKEAKRFLRKQGVWAETSERPDGTYIIVVPPEQYNAACRVRKGTA